MVSRTWIAKKHFGCWIRDG